MNEASEEWSTEFKEWIMKSVELSFELSVGNYNGHWYRQNRGFSLEEAAAYRLPILRLLCKREQVYSDYDLMEPIKSV